MLNLQKQVLTKFDAVLLTIVRYGIYFSALTPLIIFRNSFSPFNFGKVVVFRILVEILLALYIPLALKYPQFRPRFSWIFLGVILFTISFAFSSILGVNFSRSFWGSMERMGGLFTFLHLFVLFLIAISVFKKREDWSLLFKISVLASIISVAYGFSQTGESKYIVGSSGETNMRIFGTIGNAAIFSSYLLFNIYFALWLLIENWKKFIERLFYFFAILIDSSALVYASVRSAAIALFLSFFFLFIFLFLFKENLGFYKKLKWRHFFIVIIFGITFLFFYSAFLAEKIPIIEKLSETSLQERTVETRIFVWGESLQAIKEKPIFGWGPENFTVPFAKYFHPKLFIGPEEELIFDRAHNLFLDIGVVQGIVGLLIFCSLLAGVFVFSFKTAKLKNDNATFFALPPLLLAYIVHTSFIFDLFPTYLMLFYVFGFSAVFSRKQEQEPEKQKPAFFLENQKSRIAVLIFLLILTSFLAYFTNIKPAIADYVGTRGALDLAHDHYKNGVDKFQQALSYKTFVWQDVFANFVNFYISAIYRLEGKIFKDDFSKDLEFLEKNSRDALENNPDDFNLYLYAESIYLAQGSFLDPEKYLPKAENILKQVVAQYPRLHYFYQRLAYIKSLQKDYDSAIFYVQKSYDANPEFGGSKYLLGRTYIIKGEKEKGFDLAIEAIVKNKFRKPESILWLAIELAEEKKYDKLAELYSNISVEEPKYLTQLAYTYYLWEKKEKAIRFADRAAGLPNEIIGAPNLKVLAEIYNALGEKEKLNNVLERLKVLSPVQKPKEIWIPVEEPRNP